MSIKEPLYQQLLEAIPETLRAKLDDELGDCGTINVPNTVDDAIIACGRASALLVNNILHPLGGVPLVSLFLHVGALNPALIASLFASLEAVEGYSDLDVKSPEHGGTYMGWFDEWLVYTDKEVSSVSVTIDGESFSLSEEGSGVWSASWPVALGEYSAFVESDNGKSATVSFTVASWEHWPTDGEEFPEGETEVSITPDSPEDIISATVSVEPPVSGGGGSGGGGASNSWPLVLEGSSFVSLLVFAEGAYQLRYIAETASNTTIEWLANVIVSAGGIN